MMFRRARNRGLLVLFCVAAIVAASETSWAQAPSATDVAPPSPTPGAAILAGTGAVLGSIFFAPFRALVLCPLGAVAAGGTYVATLGDSEIPDYLLRLGCTGTYVISPAMIQGQEHFRRYDER